MGCIVEVHYLYIATVSHNSYLYVNLFKYSDFLN